MKRLVLSLLLVELVCIGGCATNPSYVPLASIQSNGAATAKAPICVTPISQAVREQYHLDSFYRKCLVCDGIPIVGSERVSDYAFLECAYTLDHLLHGRTMAHDALVRNRVRVAIIASSEFTMDIPEYQTPQMMAHAAFNDKRSRGLGGLPLASCAEENLLNLPSDPYWAENITIHEFSHTVANAIRRENPEWYNRLIKAYRAAIKRGDYGNSYAASNEQEYWAEGAQCWFDCAKAKNAGGAATRQQLKAKDPALAALLTEVYGDGSWRYVRTTQRRGKELAHLRKLDRKKIPPYVLRNSPRVQAAIAAGAWPISEGTRPSTKTIRSR